MWLELLEPSHQALDESHAGLKVAVAVVLETCHQLQPSELLAGLIIRPFHDLAEDLESEVLVHCNDPVANFTRPSCASSPERYSRVTVGPRWARLSQVPAGCGLDADLVDPERKRLTEQLVIVARPATAISDSEDRCVADCLTQPPDDVQLGHPVCHDVDRVIGARDANIVGPGQSDHMVDQAPKPTLGHGASRPERDLEGAVFLTRAPGELRVTAERFAE